MIGALSSRIRPGDSKSSLVSKPTAARDHAGACVLFAGRSITSTQSILPHSRVNSASDSFCSCKLNSGRPSARRATDPKNVGNPLRISTSLGSILASMSWGTLLSSSSMARRTAEGRRLRCLAEVPLSTSAMASLLVVAASTSAESEAYGSVARCSAKAIW